MDELLKLFQDSKNARIEIANSTNQQRNQAIKNIAENLILNLNQIISENKKDLDLMPDDNPKKDRLLLNENRIKEIAESCTKIIKLENPSNKEILNKTLENGLNLSKITVPFGVVGIIYESRPNVTIDVSILNIKAGNSTVLRGGSDAFNTNLILTKIIQNSLEKAGLNKNIVQLMQTDRKMIYELLNANKYIDVIIPRGSQELINFVRDNSKVPVIETGAGVCHVYVEKTAIPIMAVDIIENAKIQRPSVCNALDSIIIDKDISCKILLKIAKRFSLHNVKIFADEHSYSILKDLNYPELFHADENSFGCEFLSLACSIKTVNSFNEALNHIEKYSSKHSECIVTQNLELANIFINSVDSAVVYHNASTRFTDGNEFDLGAEIGISTQKLHARGPFALEKLVTEKWIVKGEGQTR